MIQLFRNIMENACKYVSQRSVSSFPSYIVAQRSITYAVIYHVTLVLYLHFIIKLKLLSFVR